MWKQEGFTPLPSSIKDNILKVKVEKRTINVKVKNEDLTIVVQEALPNTESNKPFSVLLLHGATFSSQTWNDIRTIHHVAALGHHVVAIDLPGGPKSNSSSLQSALPSDFLAPLIKELGLDRPIIISPSMSGGYSLPYVIGSEPQNGVKKCRGFIPVAPVATGNYYKEMQECQVPTMIVFGTNDNSHGPESTRNLREMPNAEMFPMDNAGHAYYMNQPEQWHYLVANFIRAVERMED